MAALLVVLAYYFLVILVQRLFAPKDILVSRYEAPPNVSPAVAAWLFDTSDLPRSIAAALVNMAAKQYVRIEQNGDLYSVYQLGPAVSLSLEPEEDALARTLFKGYDCFDFEEATPQFREAFDAFRCALMATTYFSQRTALFIPAWVISGLGLLYAIGLWNIFLSRLYLPILITCAIVFVIAAVRTLPGTFRKAASHLPVSSAPRLSWTAADRAATGFLGTSLIFIVLIGHWSNIFTALFTAAFLAVNAIFFQTLREQPTAMGRKAISQLIGYRKFLAEVDADVISRMNSPEKAPINLDRKHAYTVAFHLDLGWGEQFVTSIGAIVAAVQRRGRGDSD